MLAQRRIRNANSLQTGVPLILRNAQIHPAVRLANGVGLTNLDQVIVGSAGKNSYPLRCIALIHGEIDVERKGLYVSCVINKRGRDATYVNCDPTRELDGNVMWQASVRLPACARISTEQLLWSIFLLPRRCSDKGKVRYIPRACRHRLKVARAHRHVTCSVPALAPAALVVMSTLCQQY